MSDNFDALKDNEFSVSEEGLDTVSGGVMVDGIECFVYIIKWGDTLDTLACRYDTTVAMICKINKITNPGSILVRQKLLIPGRR